VEKVLYRSKALDFNSKNPVDMRYLIQKAFSLVIVLFLVTVWGVSAQDQDVTFVHGIAGTLESWEYAEGKLESELKIDGNRIKYDSDSPISRIASQNASAVSQNEIVIAHSMGGLVTRSVIDQEQGDNIDALVTAGTPHRGSIVARSLEISQANGYSAEEMLADTVNDLAVGPIRQWGIFGAGIARYFISQTALPQIIEFLTGKWDNLASLDDIAPPGAQPPSTDSNFLKNLNDNPEETLPDTRYAIWGRETAFASMQLIGALRSTFNTSDGSWVDVWTDLGEFYRQYAATEYRRAWEDLKRYYRTGDYDYYRDYLDHLSNSRGWAYGAETIFRRHPLRFAYITGELGRGAISERGTFVGGDGVVPGTSANPYFIRDSRTIEAPGGNHIELRGLNGIRALEDVLVKPDVGIEER